MRRKGGGVDGRFCVDRFCLLELAVGFLDLGFPYEILFDFLDCGLISQVFYVWAEKVPLRRCVPSGKLAGPTENPFLGDLIIVSGWLCSASDAVLL